MPEAVEESLKDKTAKGLFWGGISNGIQQILGLVFGIVLARILNAEDYGLIGMLAIFSAIASSVQESGFTAALTNKKEIRHEDYNAVFWFSILSGVAMYLILFLCAPLIADFYNKPELTSLSRFLFLGFLFGGLGTAHNAVLFKRLMVKERAKIDILAILFSGTIGVCMALNGFAYWGLATQTTSYIIICTIFRWYYSPWRPTFEFNLAPLKEMFGFSSKIFITNIFNQVSNNIFSVILGKFYSPTQVGFYAQGQKWMTMGFSFISATINGIAQPVLVQVVDDKARQCNVLRKMLRFGAFISFPLMFGLAFIGKEFILISIGEKWLDAVPFLQLFCIWGAFGYIWTLFSNMLISHERSDLYMYGVIATSIMQLLMIILMVHYGIKQMVVAYIAVYFITLICWNYVIRNLIGLKYIDVLKDIIPYLLIAIFAFTITWFITRNISNHYLVLFLKLLLSTVIYSLIVYKSNSTIFNESFAFIAKYMKRKL